MYIKPIEVSNLEEPLQNKEQAYVCYALVNVFCYFVSDLGIYFKSSLVKGYKWHGTSDTIVQCQLLQHSNCLSK